MSHEFQEGTFEESLSRATKAEIFRLENNHIKCLNSKLSKN